MQNERYVHRMAEGLLPTAHGEFRAIAYESEIEGGQSHVALVRGDVRTAVQEGEAVLVRMQPHCLAGSVFGSTLCDCKATIDASLKAIAEAGRGALIYLHHTQRGFGVDRASGDPKRIVFHRSGEARERGTGPGAAYFAGGWAGRPDSVRSGDLSHSPVDQSPDARAGAAGVRDGNCGVRSAAGGCFAALRAYRNSKFVLDRAR